MHKLLAALLVAATVSAVQQVAQPPATQTPPPPAWTIEVQPFPAGTSLDVKSKTGHTRCTLKSFEANTLTCTDGRFDLVFQRADIKTLTIHRRRRSILVGLAIGAAAGAGLGVSIAPGALRADGTVYFGAVLGVGALIGGLTDFTGSTVYKAP
jgi:hypothetical protein